MSETYEALRDGAQTIRRSTAVLRRILAAKGDEDGALARLIQEQDEVGTRLQTHAAAVRPSPAITKWSKGNAAALLNYNPRLPPDCKP